MIPFPTVGKHTDAGDDLDSARFAKAVAAHVSNHFPGTLRLDPELPATKEVHPDDLPYSQVAHGLGLSPLPVAASPQRVENKNQAVPYLFKDQPVRVVAGEDGEAWFVARDVCSVLTIPWRGDTLNQLPGDWRGMRKLRTPGNPGHGGGGLQSVTVINEAGLYKLAFRSNKPEAEEFTNWVASVVLPSIRKHGAYMTPQTIENVLDNPDLVIGLATKLKEERARSAELAIAKARLARRALTCICKGGLAADLKPAFLCSP